jgi:hypothetical protein
VEKLHEVRLLVRYDDAHGALASHRQWPFSNPAYLLTRDGRRIACESAEPTRQEENQFGVACRFALDRPLDQYTLVYQTPGLIGSRTVEFQFEKIAIAK